MAAVEIYSRTFCTYCAHARRLLESKQIEIAEYEIDMDPGKLQEMIERAGGCATVPQVFIHGRHIGGCSELIALESDGKLNALLDA